MGTTRLPVGSQAPPELVSKCPGVQVGALHANPGCSGWDKAEWSAVENEMASSVDLFSLYAK